MPSTVTDATPWRRLQELVDLEDADLLREETEHLGVREIARAMSRLSTEHQSKILTTLDPAYTADLMTEMASAQCVELLNNLEPHEAAPILDEMESADQADLLGMLPEQHAEEILGHMDPEEARDARLLTQYEDDVAGGLMITEFLAYPDTYNVAQVVQDMRERSEEYAGYSIQYTYVVDAEGKLRGVLPLRDLLLTPGPVPIQTIMIQNPLAVEEDDHLDELTKVFEDYDFLGVPVIAHDGRLLGLVRRNDVMEALGDRAQSDFLKAQGIVGGEELRSMPTLLRSRRRFSWLSINIVLNFFGAGVIAMYQDTLAQLISLAIFLPIISDMSGCSGTQAVAVTMRELSLGLVKPRDVLHVWLKEAAVGLPTGIAVGAILGLIAWISPFGLWEGNMWLGLVAGGALALNAFVGVIVGGTLPLILKALKQDPALAAGPILTTITDMCGFFLVLSFASIMLERLV